MRQKILLLLAVLLPAIAFGETIKNETLTDTYWRNVATGDWLVGFDKSHVVLDSKVWDIKSKSAKDDEYSFTITYGKETKKVIVEKLTDGKRNISIDDQDLTKGGACRLDYSILGDDMAYYKLPSKVVTRIMQFVGPRHQDEYCLVGVDGKVRSEDVAPEDLDFLEDVLKREERP